MIEWKQIQNGAVWEAMMQTLVMFMDPDSRAYTRLGPDGGVDAVSGDKLIVYQAKFHIEPSLEKTISDFKKEFAKIEGYREEKAYWKEAKTWILVTNLEINPDDELKWNDAIRQQDCLGLNIELWDWSKIRTRLDKYPEVKKSYFENEYRTFITFVEEMKYEKETAWSAGALDVDFVGRAEALEKFAAFLNSNKKICSVSGPGGMGKTRFLLECAKQKADASEWDAFWAKPEALKAQKIFECIIPERKTVLFIDELNDLSLLTGRLLPELCNGRMQKWKIVFTERTNNASTIRELSLPKYEELREPHYILPKLNNDESFHLTKSLLENVQTTNKIQYRDVNGLTEQIASISKGIPLWIALTVRILAKDQNLLALNGTAEELIEKYFRLLQPDLSTIPISEKNYQEIAKWCAVYGVLNLENKEVITYIASAISLSKMQLKKLLNLMVDTGLAIRYGARHRYFALAPDAIRDKILVEALIDDGEISFWGEHLVDKLLKDEIPSAFLIIKNLARVESIQSVDSNIFIPILDPFIKALTEKVKKQTPENQVKSISLLPYFDFARPEESLNLLKICWSTDNGVAKENAQTSWECTHQDVMNEIPRALSSLAHYCNSTKLKEGIVNFFIEIIKSHKVQAPYLHSAPLDLLSQVLFDLSDSDEYQGIAQKKLDSFLKQCRQNAMGDVDIEIMDMLLKRLFSLERRNTFYYNGKLTFTSVPASEQKLETAKKYLEKIKALLAEVAINATITKVLVNSYCDFFNNVRIYSKLHQDENAFNPLLKKELSWMADFLQTEAGKRAFLRNPLKEKVWKWFLDFPEDDALQPLAQKCEQAYTLEIEDKEIVSFLDNQYESIEETREKENNIFEHRLSEKSDKDILTFLEKVEYYLKEKRDYRIRSLGYLYGTRLSASRNVEALGSSLLNSDIPSARWAFGMGMIIGRSDKLRQSKISSAQEELKKYLSFVSAKDAFLYEYYNATGSLDIQDFSILKKSRFLFKNPVQYSSLLGLFTFQFVKPLCEYMDSIWSELDPETKKNYVEKIVDSIYWIKQNNNHNKLQWTVDFANWVIKKMVSFEELNWMDSLYSPFGELPFLQKLKNIQWLLKTIQNRKNFKHPFSSRFSFAYFVSSDFSESETQAFSDIIEWVHQPYLIKRDIYGEIVALDPENRKLGQLVSQKFLAAKTDEERLNLARIAGELTYEKDAWKEISRTVCEYAIHCDNELKNYYYSELDWKGIEDYSCSYGQVASTYYQKVKTLKDEKEKDTCTARQEYWQIRLEWSEKSLENAKEEARELRGE